MLSIRIDQFEFEDSGSEEAVEIDVSRPSKFPHPDVNAFVGATVGNSAVATLAEPQPFHRVQDRQRISDYIKRFARIEIPVHVDWPSYRLASNSWEETHLVIGAPGAFIRYRWSTSA